MSGRRKEPGGEAPERRGRDDDAAVPGDGRLPPEVEKRLLEVAGFDRKALYERRGALICRGLAALLERGDEVVEVHPDHARIRRVDGVEQTFWNLDADPPWLTRVDAVDGG